MDELFGIPAHPLIVHAPVVLLPLAVMGVVAMLLRPAWYLHFRWPVLAITAVGTLGAIFAASSGEERGELVEDSESSAAREAIEEHLEETKGQVKTLEQFLVAVVAFVVIPWLLERRARAAAAAGSTDVATAPPSAGPTCWGRARRWPACPRPACSAALTRWAARAARGRAPRATVPA